MDGINGNVPNISTGSINEVENKEEISHISTDTAMKTNNLAQGIFKTFGKQ